MESILSLSLKIKTEWKIFFFAKKITIKIVAIKNKVLSLQSLIVLSDAIVVSATNLVILSIYLKHKNTHNADIIRYCKTVKHLVGSARSCGKELLLFYLSYMIAQPLWRLVVLSLPLPGCWFGRLGPDFLSPLIFYCFIFLLVAWGWTGEEAPVCSCLHLLRIGRTR